MHSEAEDQSIEIWNQYHKSKPHNVGSRAERVPEGKVNMPSSLEGFMEVVYVISVNMLIQ